MQVASGVWPGDERGLEDRSQLASRGYFSRCPPENPVTPEFCERFAKINNEQKVLANEMGESLAGSKG
jgi:hypothetical protein